MLTNLDREILKPVLGKRYSSAVLKILQAKEVTKANGEAYGNSSVTAVFNGKRDNHHIELAIWELYKRIEKESQRLDEIRKSAKDK